MRKSNIVANELIHRNEEIAIQITHKTFNDSQPVLIVTLLQDFNAASGTANNHHHVRL